MCPICILPFSPNTMIVSLKPCDHVLCARCYNEMSFYRRLAHGDPPLPASEYKCPTCRSPFTWSTADKFSTLPTTDDDDILEVGVTVPPVPETVDLTTPDSKPPAYSSQYRYVSNSNGNLRQLSNETETQLETYTTRRDTMLEEGVNFIIQGGVDRNPNALPHSTQRTLVNALIQSEEEDRVKRGLRPIPNTLRVLVSTPSVLIQTKDTLEEILTTLKDNINKAYNDMERSVNEAKAKFCVNDIPTLKRSLDELIEATDEYKYAVDSEIDEHIVKIKKVKACINENIEG